MLCSSETYASFLRPVSNAVPSVGSNICPRNPDVEVMAMTLNDTPLTMTGFHEMDGGRGWYNTKFLLLGIGPPGFSSVPYTASKKKGEKEVGKRLYELADDGVTTRFFTYEPGKTNKDRGVRVAVGAIDEQPDQDLTATLVPGMCITQFTSLKIIPFPRALQLVSIRFEQVGHRHGR